MKVLLLNQCFYPDVVSTAQHLTDLALGLAEQGHQVTVLASRRGYDNPEQRFQARENWKGVEIIRIPTLGLGKSAKWRRAADFASFLVICFVRLMFLPRQALTVALTSPPLISFFGALFARLRGGRFCFWVMDLNPDEAVAAGWLKENSLLAHILQVFLKYSLKHSDRIIALDRFMLDRIVAKGIAPESVTILPPWSHDEEITYDEPGRNAFRAKHGLVDKYVVMYSGNHSPCHSLDTLLQAAQQMQQRPDIAFCFVGGGSEFQKVKNFVAQHTLDNIHCLPYQPLNELSGSLSAGDLHVVVMGDAFKGLVHPCKIYNIIAIGAPFLYIGPRESHVSDLVQRDTKGLRSYSARHGAVAEVVAHIQAAAAKGPVRVAVPEAITAPFAHRSLVPRLVAVLEQLAGVAQHPSTSPTPPKAQARRA